MYGGSGTTTAGTPTSGAGLFGEPCGVGGKLPIANLITIRIWRDFC